MCVLLILQITKNRFTGDLGRVPLKFDRDSLTLSNYFATLKHQKQHQQQQKQLQTKLHSVQTCTPSHSSNENPASSGHSSLQPSNRLPLTAANPHPVTPQATQVGSLSHLSGKLSNATSKLESLSTSDKGGKSKHTRLAHGSTQDSKAVSQQKLSRGTVPSKHSPKDRRRLPGLSPLCADCLNRAE